MVSYYQTEPIPNPVTVSMTSVLPNLEIMNPKNLVCSPDLPVFGSTTCTTAATVAVESLANTNEDKAYQCLLCQKIFDQKNLYQSHLRSHSKEGEDPYQCDKCDKTFAVPARLTRHYRTHTGEKPFQCEYCHKSFSVKENLSVHRRIHTKERPYKCDVCERAFEHSGKLHRHMRIHTGERPHKCTVCSKTFIQSGQLVIHMRTHTGEKPYVCKSCGKGFTCSKQLKVHTRTHTGEKPYTCDICGKSFGYNHVLKLHQVAHYGEKVYKCTLCHETFSSKKTMELHIKTHSDSSSSSTSTSSSTSSSSSSPFSSSLSSSSSSSSSSSTSSTSSSSSTSSGISSARDSPIESIMEISQSNSVILNNAPSPIPPIPNGSNKELPRKNVDNIPCSPSEVYPNQRDFSYYVFPREQYPQSVASINGPMSLLNGGVEERSVHQIANLEQQSHVFLYSDISSSPYTITEFAFPSRGAEPMVSKCPSLMNLPGNDARRRVEAALEAVEEERQREYGMNVKKEEQILTPPSSNPVSPAPSPDPLDLAIPVRETLILPPRKRCKMILESMESEKSANLLGSQRQSSVIHFARAS